jgi:hypothetical protein
VAPFYPNQPRFEDWQRQGVNRNRITVHEINADRSFNLSAHSFQFRDFDFAAIHFRGAIASAISLGWFHEYVI